MNARPTFVRTTTPSCVSSQVPVHPHPDDDAAYTNHARNRDHMAAELQGISFAQFLWCRMVVGSRNFRYEVAGALEMCCTYTSMCLHMHLMDICYIKAVSVLMRSYALPLRHTHAHTHTYTNTHKHTNSQKYACTLITASWWTVRSERRWFRWRTCSTTSGHGTR